MFSKYPNNRSKKNLGRTKIYFFFSETTEMIFIIFLLYGISAEKFRKSLYDIDHIAKCINRNQIEQK